MGISNFIEASLKHFDNQEYDIALTLENLENLGSGHNPLLLSEIKLKYFK